MVPEAAQEGMAGQALVVLEAVQGQETEVLLPVRVEGLGRGPGLVALRRVVVLALETEELLLLLQLLLQVGEEGRRAGRLVEEPAELGTMPTLGQMPAREQATALLPRLQVPGMRPRLVVPGKERRPSVQRQLGCSSLRRFAFSNRFLGEGVGLGGVSAVRQTCSIHLSGSGSVLSNQICGRSNRERLVLHYPYNSKPPSCTASAGDAALLVSGP